MDDDIELDFVITERDTNQRASSKEPVNKEKLWKDKEKIYLDKPWTGPCPDDSHPLFMIKVGPKSPHVVSCYYCSKTWIYRDDGV